MAGDLKGRRIRPGNKDPQKGDILAVTSGSVAKYDVVAVTGISGGFITVARASNTSLVQSRGLLFMVRGTTASGGRVLVAPFGTILDVDTSSLAIGDPMYLSTNGDVMVTPGGFSRLIGTVSKIGASGVGEILFHGSMPGIGSVGVKTGTAVVTTGNPSVTILAATLGGVYGGFPVVATLNTADGAVFLKSATWSTNDLVLTLSANAGTNDTVAYAISIG